MAFIVNMSSPLWLRSWGNPTLGRTCNGGNGAVSGKTLGRAATGHYRGGGFQAEGEGRFW